MNRPYLLVYSDTLGSRQEVKNYLNSMNEILTWRYDLPNSFYLVSDSNARVLAKRLRELAGDKGRFIITEISANDRGGWLTADSWYLINNHRLKTDSK
jgi:hypothetical protein